MGTRDAIDAMTAELTKFDSFEAGDDHLIVLSNTKSRRSDDNRGSHLFDNSTSSRPPIRVFPLRKRVTIDDILLWDHDDRFRLVGECLYKANYPEYGMWSREPLEVMEPPKSDDGCINGHYRARLDELRGEINDFVREAQHIPDNKKHPLGKLLKLIPICGVVLNQVVLLIQDLDEVIRVTGENAVPDYAVQHAINEELHSVFADIIDLDTNTYTLCNLRRIIAIFITFEKENPETLGHVDRWSKSLWHAFGDDVEAEDFVRLVVFRLLLLGATPQLVRDEVLRLVASFIGDHLPQTVGDAVYLLDCAVNGDLLKKGHKGKDKAKKKK